MMTKAMMVMMVVIVVVMETEINMVMLLVIGSDDNYGDHDDSDGYDDGDKVSTSWTIMIRHRITHAFLSCQKFVHIF